jgi:hypothetical protein
VEPTVVTRRTWTIAGVVAVAVVVVVLVVLQLTLKGIAEGKVRDEIGDDGAKVTVKASPALKLLFGDADEITIDTPTVAGDQQAPLGKLLARAKDVGRTDARVGQIQVAGEAGNLTLRDVRAVVEDGRVQATASLSIRELAALVPGGGTLRALSSGSGGEPRFSVTVPVPLLGDTTVNGVVAAQDGAVQVAAEGLPIPVAITIFQDPSIAVDAVQGRSSGDRLRISFSGTLN